MDKNIVELLKKKGTLTMEEENIVFHYYKLNKNQEIRNMIIEKNIGLCRMLANKYSGVGVETEDLEQEGVFGLITAIENFEPERGYKFSTYAYHWIKQGMTRYIANSARTIRLPVHVVDKLLKIKAVQTDYEKEHATEAPMSYIAEQLGMKEADVKDLILKQTASSTASLNAKIKRGNGDDPDENELGDLIQDNKVSYTENVELNYDFQLLHRILEESLSSKEYEVISMRFGLKNNIPMTLEEVGEVFGVTRERIRQIEKKALGKIGRRREVKAFYNNLAEYLN